jgi:iron-sulfur cluster assembly protein
VLSLTESAIEAVRAAMARASDAPGGLRIQVEAGGCAGFKYVMGLVPEPAPADDVLRFDDVAVFVDPASQPLLAGTQVDFVVALEGSGFTFENPNAANSCSCGKSFG